MISVEVGRFYEDGSGEVLGPMRETSFDTYPFLAKTTTKRSNVSRYFSKNGRCNLGATFDLVRERGDYPIDLSNYMSMDEAVKMIPLSKCSIYQLSAAGCIRRVKLDGRVYLNKDSVATWMAAQYSAALPAGVERHNFIPDWADLETAMLLSGVLEDEIKNLTHGEKLNLLSEVNGFIQYGDGNFNFACVNSRVCEILETIAAKQREGNVYGYVTPPHSPLRVKLLLEGTQLTSGARDKEYGPPAVNMACSGALKKALRDHMTREMTPAELEAIDMALTKIGRLATGTPKRDNYVDAATYLAIAGEIGLSEKSE
ncbi:MAG: DUF6378 domain-containing protein [Brucella intermedia]